MPRYYKIENDKLAETPDAEAAVWVYTNPDASERQFLIETLKLDEHTLTSALDPNEIGRVEFEPEHFALIIKRPKRYSSADNFLFKVLSIGIFLFANRLIIVTDDEFSPFDGRKFMKVSSLRDVLLKLIYSSIFHFEEHLKVINMCSDQLEREVNKAMENRQLYNMFTLEKSLVYYLNAISSNGRVIERLKTNSPKLGLSTEDVELLDDIAIENAQCFEQANIYSQVISSLMDARVSVVSNNLNLLMKSLTFVMIALMLPTLWTSFFSMNVPIPLQHSTRIFWFIIIMAAALVLTVLGIRKYKKW